MTLVIFIKKTIGYLPYFTRKNGLKFENFHFRWKRVSLRKNVSLWVFQKCVTLGMSTVYYTIIYTILEYLIILVQHAVFKLTCEILYYYWGCEFYLLLLIYFCNLNLEMITSEQGTGQVSRDTCLAVATTNDFKMKFKESYYLGTISLQRL